MRTIGNIIYFKRTLNRIMNTYNVAVIGTASCGKSQFIFACADKEKSSQFSRVPVKLNNQTYTCNAYEINDDTSADQKEDILRRADFVLVVYDGSSHTSARRVNAMRVRAMQICDPSTPILFVRTKSDLMVRPYRLALRPDDVVISVSAKTGTNCTAPWQTGLAACM